jgi:hypothetical protein
MGYMAGDEEEGERMAEERIPEAWIGGYVIMMPTADITMEHVVLLRDVRDFGILYELEEGGGLVFAPWPSIRALRLVEGGDVMAAMEDREAQQRRLREVRERVDRMREFWELRGQEGPPETP